MMREESEDPSRYVLEEDTQWWPAASEKSVRFADSEAVEATNLNYMHETTEEYPVLHVPDNGSNDFGFQFKIALGRRRGRPRKIRNPEMVETPKPSTSKVNAMGKKTRLNFKKDAIKIMERWLMANMYRPYPSDCDKQIMAQESGLSVTQVSYWFINARRRILPEMIRREGRNPNHYRIFKKNVRDTVAAAAARLILEAENAKIGNKERAPEMDLSEEQEVSAPIWISSTDEDIEVPEPSLFVEI